MKLLITPFWCFSVPNAIISEALDQFNNAVYSAYTEAVQLLSMRSGPVANPDIWKEGGAEYNVSAQQSFVANNDLYAFCTEKDD